MTSLNTSLNSPLSIALDYIRRGWNPLPVTFRGKDPQGDTGWQTRVIDAASAPRFFNAGPLNIGVLLGPTSHGLTDVDLDCAEAIAIAPYILPPTGAIFGRASKRASHWLYASDLSGLSSAAAVRFRAPDGAVLAELRIGGGGKGAQTVFPGSVHFSSEPIVWEPGKDGEPAATDGKDLAHRVRILAAACLVARAWPAPGGRHNAALVIGGVLARVGMTEGVAACLVEAIARAAGDTELHDRTTAARDAVRNFRAGGPTAGFVKLTELAGQAGASKIADWLDYRHLDYRHGEQQNGKNQDGDQQARGPQDAQQLDGGEQQGGEADAAVPEDAGGVTLRHFYAYMPTHYYVFVPARDLWPAVSVNARIAPIPLFDKAGLPLLDKKGEQVLQAANKWLDRNKPIELMTWSPGSPAIIRDRLISEGGWIEHKGAAVFNLYRPPIVAPGNASNAGRWLDHVHKIYPDDADHAIKWLAHRVQRPAEKINHALMLGGKPGIGKDTMLEPVRRGVGPWNFQEVSPQQVLGRFNGFLKSVILRISEVRDLGDHDRFAFYEHMKAYTAAPPDVLRIDEKNLREYNIPNCTGVVITTNHRLDGLYLPADDRRHYVAWSPLSKEDFDDDYWRSIWRWYVGGGDCDVVAYLAELDISDFDPKAAPKKTLTFWDIADASNAPEEAELADLLDKIGRPYAVTLSRIQSEAAGGFGEWINDRKNRRTIPHRMEKCGYLPVRNPEAKDGLWYAAGRRQVVYGRDDLPIAGRLQAARRLVVTGI